MSEKLYLSLEEIKKRHREWTVWPFEWHYVSAEKLKWAIQWVTQVRQEFRDRLLGLLWLDEDIPTGSLVDSYTLWCKVWEIINSLPRSELWEFFTLEQAYNNLDRVPYINIDGAGVTKNPQVLGIFLWLILGRKELYYLRINQSLWLNGICSLRKKFIKKIYMIF